MSSDTESSTLSTVAVPALLYPYPVGLNVSNFLTIKLNLDNYLLWESQVRTLAESCCLEGFLDGTESQPRLIVLDKSGLPDTNPRYKAWLRTDRLLKGWISGSVTEEVMGEIVGCKTSSEVWSTLGKRFAESTQSREFELKSQLRTFSKNSDALDVYLRKFKGICDQLNAIGCPVAEQDKVFTLLNGLDNTEYEGFVISMLKPPIPQYAELVSLLQDFERRKSRRTGSTQPLVFYANRNESEQTSQGYYNYSQRGRGSFRGRGRSQNVNYMQGILGSGPTQNVAQFTSQGRGFSQVTQQTGGVINNNQENTVRPPLFCQICGKRGHDALRCWHRFDNAYQNTNSPKGLTDVTTTALAALRVNENDFGEWHVDFGATDHIVQNTGLKDTPNPGAGTM